MRFRAGVLGLALLFSSLSIGAIPEQGFAATSAYEALRITTTGGGTITLAPEEKKQITLTLQNIGSTTWKNDGPGYISLYTYEPKYRKSAFDPGTWLGPTQVRRMQEASVAPGNIGTLSFELHAPPTPGIYKETFALAAEDIAWIPGGQVTLTLNVQANEQPSNDLATSVAAPTQTAEQESTFQNGAQESVLQSEPTMRVGVLIVDEETNWEVRIGSQASDVELRDSEGNHLFTIPKGSDLRAAYSNGVYVYGEGDTQKTSALPLRFIPTTSNAVLEVTNFDRRITRQTQYANNTFRNVLELRYNTKKNRTWLINELPMEYYLRGLAETSNASPEEFQKALMTAARTYAYYHYANATKHAAEGYHVDAYRDQVYWGYGQEERNPLITAGVEATRGHVVTYEGQTAITSYFSRSDGRTRNWNEVWGGSVPYAKSVSVPCDQGKSLWGHGVGMSASGAICMAKEGKTWEEILTYFYTGIEITKTWK